MIQPTEPTFAPPSVSTRRTCVATLLFILLSAPPVLNGNDCDCTPPKQTSAFSDRFHIDSSANQIASIIESARVNWNTQLSNGNAAIRLQNLTGGGSVKISIDSSVCGSAWADTKTQYSYMKICPDALTTTDGVAFVHWLIRHEMGHMLGIAHGSCPSTRTSSFEQRRCPARLAGYHYRWMRRPQLHNDISEGSRRGWL